jgi:hypothetical protein
MTVALRRLVKLPSTLKSLLVSDDANPLSKEVPSL